MFLVYNSDILVDSDFQVSVTDRAFQYGDGLFETIRYENGRLWFWDDHIARVSAGMAALQLAQPADFTSEAIHQAVLQLLSVNKLTRQPARIKLQVWRQTGGLYTPSTNDANVLITTQPGHSFSITEKAQIGLYDTLRLAYSPVSAFKTLNALPYVLAGLHKRDNGFDDVILLDTQGHLAECLASNLFWYANQTLYTPSLLTGCVNGIIRRQLLRLAPLIGITVQEGLYQPDALSHAEAVFCANVMGIQWLRRVNGITVPATQPLANDTAVQLDVLFAQLHG